MTKYEQNVIDAKKTIKAHIKFFEALLKNLNGSDETVKGGALWVGWCLHRYINDDLVNDVKKAMIEQGGAV